MPTVTMPDGTPVEMPDELTPELGKRLRAMHDAASPVPQEPGYLESMKNAALNSLGGTGIANPVANTAIALFNEGQRKLQKSAYGAGSDVAGAAGKIGLPASVAGGAGVATNMLINAVPNALPIGGGAAAAGGIAAPLAKSVATSLMQSAVKPGVAKLLSGDAAKGIQTLLDEGINITTAGMAKLQGKINDLKKEAQTLIDASPAGLNRQKIGDALQSVIDKFSMQVTPQSDIRAVQDAWGNFKNHPLLQNIPPTGSIPVKLAQELKKGTYLALGDKSYGELKGADIEAQKTLARALKSGIEEQVPGVAPINAKLSELINAFKVANPRALMESNKNPAGLSFLADRPEMMALFALDRSARFKSGLARLLNWGGEGIGETAGASAGGLASLLNQQQP